MAKMTWLERRYRRSRLDYVRHITIDPRGPGVVRIHMIPPRTEDPADPFLLLLNGAQLVPLNLSWAILLANFMDQLEPWSGREIGEQDWQSMLSAAVKATRRTYPGTGKAVLLGDLELMLRSIVAIARGQEPPAEVGALSLGEYAGRMSAPHRMDLMISAMTREGRWHCNQKCLHCYAAGQTLGETPELTTDQWRELLEKLRRANIPQVTFTGGEPTLRPDLPELVEAAQWFVTRLNTNGRLLTPELCRRLFEASLDSVQVTLYAADAAVHNALVGEESRATRLSQEELTDILRQAAETAHGLGMELDFTSPGWLPEEALRDMGLHLIPSCGACLSNMALAPDGTVLPCQSWLEGPGLGNLLTDDWSGIWDGELCRRIRAESAKMEHICQLRQEGGC